jgi:uncharacterized membrane protein YdjX (TVP38/TMEM64 family)
VETVLAFAVTWVVILSPPFLVRALLRQPMPKGPAAGVCVLLYFGDVVLFEALGSTGRSHLAPLVGAFLAFLILRRHTQASARALVAAQRKAMGYEKPSDER